jgi:hypothetical protein
MSGYKSSNPSGDATDEPVLMTTHDVAGLAADRPRVGAGRIKLLLLFLACAAPVIASYFTYYVIQPDLARSYGTLIQPPLELPDVVAHDLQGQAKPLRELRDQWLLVSVGPSACDEACQQRLYMQRQIRESMGPERARVDWVWLISDDQPVAPELLPALANAQVWRVDPEVLSAWLQAAPGQSLSDHLYLVDPMGMWMMRFPAQPDGKKLRADLAKVLKASQFWDEEGRQR